MNDGNISFSWIDNSGDGTAKKNDRAILVAYFPESQESVFSFTNAERKDGMAKLEMGPAKGTAQTWLGFLSADEANAANSVYTGVLVI